MTPTDPSVRLDDVSYRSESQNRKSLQRSSGKPSERLPRGLRAEEVREHERCSERDKVEELREMDRRNVICLVAWGPSARVYCEGDAPSTIPPFQMTKPAAAKNTGTYASRMGTRRERFASESRTSDAGDRTRSAALQASVARLPERARTYQGTFWRVRDYAERRRRSRGAGPPPLQRQIQSRRCWSGGRGGTPPQAVTNFQPTSR